MKLCGRIDCDQALMRYRFLLRKADRMVPADTRSKKKQINGGKRAKECWKIQLADELR